MTWHRDAAGSPPQRAIVDQVGLKRRLLACLCLAAAAAGGNVLPAGAWVLPPPSCAAFPADNVWNADISSLPVNPHSAQWMGSMASAGRNLHPDFGPTGNTPSDANPPYGIPFNVVDASHPKVQVSFDYSSESDKVAYPLGADTHIEGGTNASGDRHALVVDQSTCTLYETYATQSQGGQWHAGSGAVFDLRSDALRPAGWTSADAAGLPIYPGLLRYDEVAAGTIRHAIRFTAQSTDRSYLWPARHQAGARNDPKLPPMGARFRLSAGYSLAGFSAQAQAVLQAMKHYGLMLADNGSNWFFQGTADDRWSGAFVSELKRIPASAFEAVDESALMVDPNSARVRGGGQLPWAPPPPVPGHPAASIPVRAAAATNPAPATGPGPAASPAPGPSPDRRRRGAQPHPGTPGGALLPAAGAGQGEGLPLSAVLLGLACGGLAGGLGWWKLRPGRS